MYRAYRLSLPLLICASISGCSGNSSDNGTPSAGAPGGGAANGGAGGTVTNAGGSGGQSVAGSGSSGQTDEAGGATYSEGTKKDIFALLKAHGFNYIRLRTFVDPKATDGYDKTNGYADLAHTIAFGKRIKAAGLGLLVDFHYSDNWAD